MLKEQFSRIKAKGIIKGYKNEIQMVRKTLASASMWQPGIVLQEQCNEVLSIIENLQERMEKKLVATIIGPSGSGKSTLLNALSGVDDLSPSGIERPTTTEVVALCRQKKDCAQLVHEVGEDEMIVRSDPGAIIPDNVILVDTPDTDSTQKARHIPVIKKVVALSDVLICVFDAENPKRKDHTDFMAPLVARFSGTSLVVAVNRCDRLSRKELQEVIIPDFTGYIRDAWETNPLEILAVSGKRHLKNPGWDPKAGPRHDLDQFDMLKNYVFDTCSAAGFSRDRRLENARRLKEFLISEVKKEVETDREKLGASLELITDAENRAMQTALVQMKKDDSRLHQGVDVQLYQNMAQKWVGPVGWLVAVWARILVFGTGLLSLLRFGNPFRQVLGAVSTVKHFRTSLNAVEDAKTGKGVDTALTQYNNILMQNWPDIAGILVSCRFDTSVKEIEAVLQEEKDLGLELSRIWSDALYNEVELAGKRLSNPFMQIIFNLPVIIIMGYAGWLTAVNFFMGNVLPSNFFLHAFWTIILILFLCFFLFQAIARLFAGRNKLVARAFETLGKETKNMQPLSQSMAAGQVRTILNMTGPDKIATRE